MPLLTKNNNYHRIFNNSYTLVWLFMSMLIACKGYAQYTISGQIFENNAPSPFTVIGILNQNNAVVTNPSGFYELKNISDKNIQLKISKTGFKSFDTTIILNSEKTLLNFHLKPISELLNEIVVTGTMRPINKDESPINIDIIHQKLFQAVATTNLYDASGILNGVKPQNACNVCNTGEIQINGLAGPYTLILIDGMPIVSGLSSVYGLSGIPTGIINRLEIAKGPSASLYGSEAMGGVINVITKDPCKENTHLIADYSTNTWKENNFDLGFKSKSSKYTNSLTGINGYWYNTVIDNNKDGFTDLSLQKRIGLFHKIDFERVCQKPASIAIRGIAENRWGGQTHWTEMWRGSDSVYGESIDTKRTELIAKYQWDLKEQLFTQLSYNFHQQNSHYGTSPFIADQSTGFIQTYWDKPINKHNLLMGISYKHLWFDDNTVATFNALKNNNQPQTLHTIGFFIQDEWQIDSLKRHLLLLGGRVDYNNFYGLIPSPRIAYKFSPNQKHIFRINGGTGFRIVNVFTEDHLSLNGARTVVFKEKIKPEESFNFSFNYLFKMPFLKEDPLVWDLSLFYYHFTNKVIANYDSDPQLIMYENLKGYAFSRGGSFNLSGILGNYTNYNFGITYSDVQSINPGMATNIQKNRQLFAPKWSGTFMINQSFGKRKQYKIDLSSNYNGPMRLPVLPNDFRDEYSPWFIIMNVQMTYTFKKHVEIYGGCKNLFNFLPKNPIMRPFDPFDKLTSDKENNPNGYKFDPSYTYASMQGRRFHLGIRIRL